MTDIKKYKDVSKQMMKIIHSIDSSARIMGGMPRDLYFNKEINDIDIYSKIENYKIILDNLDSKVTCHYIKDNVYNTDDGVVSTIDYLTIEGIEVNLIGINIPPVEYIESFDCDICKFMYDAHEDKISIHFDINNLLKTKVILLNPNLNEKQLVYARRHIDKIRKKYPEFRVFLDNSLEAIALL